MQPEPALSRAPVATPPTRPPWRLRGNPALTRFGPTVALLVMWALFSLLTPRFLTISNFRDIVAQSSIPLILAVGLTFVIIGGMIDLSIEGVMAVSAVAVSLLVLNNRNDLDLGLLGVAIAIALGGLMGFLNGLFHVWLRIPSFMVTLGMWSVGAGIATILYKGMPVAVMDPMVRNWVLGTTLGFSNLVLFALAVLAIGWFIERFTRVGRYAYVIGGSEEIARLAGVPLGRYKIALFTFAGLCSGLGGVLIAARLGQGTSNVGAGTLFAAVTAVVVGGTALSGGTGGVLQTLVGVLFVTSLNNGMILLGIDPYVQQTVQGVLIVIAVSLTMDRKRVPIIK